MRNKRGNEIVEASIVLPIIILTILSMIMLMIFFFACLTTQMSVHQRLINKALKSDTILSISRSGETTGRKIGGVISMLMKKEISSRCYLINEVTAIRLGEAIHGDTD